MNEKAMNGGKVSTVSFDEFTPPTKKEWQDEVLAALKGAPFEKRMYTNTYEGIRLNPIYTEEDMAAVTEDKDLPGIPSFRRGAAASGYVAEPWDISQSCTNVLPEEANLSMLNEIKKGSDTFYFELDACTRSGRDPDQEFFRGDYRGVSVSNLEDADKLLKGMDLSVTPVHIYAGTSVVPLLSLIAAEARASGRGGSIKEYKGCIGADPLGELAAEG
ncbi:MAG: methylmalonyl-CoA mutase family protein, partial [Synergistaceae bacterium]|nr:methylmalonyl-CoA mutase family protein [Synergistaceae bacterium]